MSKSLADNPFVTEAKDKNGDSWYHQIILEKKEEEIERLKKEAEKYKKRCYEALTLIRENYGLLDKYGIDMLDDILNGK